MENPLKKTETLLGQQVQKVSHHAAQAFNGEIETIINQTISSPEIEAVVIQSIERVILSLGKRYWKLLVTGTIGLLLLQSLSLYFMLRGLVVVIK